jgi:D-alanyl-lipoteichoic acid acyltransferase DltB (MBOAT superfamily)
LYPIQLYADFSGYSDIAIGIGKTLGFRITKNFSYPFFQRNIAEFWKNWHISLTSWLTDYVFTPLNFSFRKMKKRGVIYALIINFILVGLWHGANWTFVVVGLYYGLLYIPLILSGAMFKESKVETCSYGLPQIKTFYQMLCTYFLVALGDIFFRAKDISQAYEFISSIFSSSLFSIPSGGIAVLIAVLFILFEWIGRKEEYPLKRIKSKLPFRVLVYWVMIFLIFWFGSHEQQFIYTQF